MQICVRINYKKNFFINFNIFFKKQIKHERNAGKDVFNGEGEGRRMAELEYYITNNNLMSITHTGIDGILKGKNVNNQLVNAAEDFAQTNHYKIFSLCPIRQCSDKNEKIKFAHG